PCWRLAHPNGLALKSTEPDQGAPAEEMSGVHRLPIADREGLQLRCCLREVPSIGKQSPSRQASNGHNIAIPRGASQEATDGAPNHSRTSPIICCPTSTGFESR